MKSGFTPKLWPFKPVRNIGFVKVKRRLWCDGDLINTSVIN